MGHTSSLHDHQQKLAAQRAAEQRAQTARASDPSEGDRTSENDE